MSNIVGNTQGTNSGIFISGATGTTSIDSNFVGINTADASIANVANGITVSNTAGTVNIGTGFGNFISNNVQIKQMWY